MFSTEKTMKTFMCLFLMAIGIASCGAAPEGLQGAGRKLQKRDIAHEIKIEGDLTVDIIRDPATPIQLNGPAKLVIGEIPDSDSESLIDGLTGRITKAYVTGVLALPEDNQDNLDLAITTEVDIVGLAELHIEIDGAEQKAVKIRGTVSSGAIELSADELVRVSYQAGEDMPFKGKLANAEIVDHLAQEAPEE